MAHSHYINYYVTQAQTGKGMTYFSGLPYQKGHGIGSFLGGLFRTIFPFFKQGVQTVGREALRAGSHVLADVAAGAQPFNTSIKAHAAEAGQNLMNKMSEKLKGNGIKRLKISTPLHLKRGSRRRRTTPYKKKNFTDIWS